MNSPLIQLIVLAGIAVFLILRLKSVLGTREGFEKPPEPRQTTGPSRPDLEVIEGGRDRDITDYVTEGSPQAEALAEMKRAEPSFSVAEFVQGSRGAYEMVVMGFEHGELDNLQSFLAEDVFDAFVDGVAAREDQGLVIEADFIGVRETKVADVEFDPETRRAEITMRFVGEMTSVVRDAEGKIVEGSPTEIKRQRDTWVFAREMGSSDPNWTLIATDA